jgi:hypothetical protein
VNPQQRERITAAFVKTGMKIAHDLMEEVTTPHIASPDVHVDHERQQIVTYYHGLAMPGQFYRADSWFDPFSEGRLLFNQNMRHSAVLVRGDQLLVFWTQVGDAPEHIKLSTVNLAGDWQQWQNTAGVELLRPENAWEGAAAAAAVAAQPSMRSTAYGRVNQLRDPAIYVENDRVFLLYAVAGESGIALAEVKFADK